MLVLGTARSGTSALAGVLDLLGVELGSRLRPARADTNAKGFFEHVGVHAHHTELFRLTGSDWAALEPRPERFWNTVAATPIRSSLQELLAREFGEHPLWGFKDPELCLLFPLWEEMLRELRVEPLPVLLLRVPAEAAASFARMRGVDPELGRLVWLRTVLAAERATRGRRRAIVTYDGLLEDWRLTADRIAAPFGLEWPRSPDTVRAEVDEFVDRSLRHHVAAGTPANDPLDVAAQELYDAFRAAEAGDPSLLPAALAAAEGALGASEPVPATVVPILPLRRRDRRRSAGALLASLLRADG